MTAKKGASDAELRSAAGAGNTRDRSTERIPRAGACQQKTLCLQGFGDKEQTETIQFSAD
ncbi:MAG: hypothetical protein IPM18_15905 [Phycisphaerales bacterium]|nr:hypothetical protein [Phycisphaerales bacterium]